MADYGQQTLQTVGNALQVIASDFEKVNWKAGGITIDWAKVAAVSGSDVTLPNGTVIPIGQKYIDMGTVLVKITSGGTTGYYGPADTTATDGRQTVDATRRGEVYINNEVIAQNPLGGALVQTASSDHPGVFDGGPVWRSRLHIGGTNEPTLANFLAAFPLISFVSM